MVVDAVSAEVRLTSPVVVAAVAVAESGIRVTTGDLVHLFALHDLIETRPAQLSPERCIVT